MLSSYYCDYRDAYIVVKGGITVEGTANANKRIKKVTFNNNDLFRSCISKTKNAIMENGENLDIVIPMYQPYSG